MALHYGGAPTDLTGYVPYVGATADVDLGAFKLWTAGINDGSGVEILKTSTRELFDVSSLVSVDIQQRFLKHTGGLPSVDWESGYLYKPSTSTTVIDYDTGYMYDASGLNSIEWFGRYLMDAGITQSIHWDSRFAFDFTGVSSIDWGNRKLIDSGGFNAMEWSTSYRHLFDFGGSYPSVDYGNYYLMNIGITNGVPLLDWSTGAGGSVKIYDGYAGYVVGDFTNKHLLDSSGFLRVDWLNMYLYDNYNQISVDWNYHTLLFNAILSQDWQNRYLYATDGTTIVLNYQTQQTTAVTGATLTGGGGTGLTDTDTFDGYTVAQIVGALRAYGLLA